MKTIYLAGGCFWGTQHLFRQIDGVLSTRVGYANGKTENPTYEQVKYWHTGHAETVEIVYDETVLPTPELLEYYFMAIDPTSVNKQGPDEGEQYRTGIYYTDEGQRADAEAALAVLSGKLGVPLAVECCPILQFFPAEEYHQDYLIKNPAGYCHIPRDLIRTIRQRAAENRQQARL